MATVIVALAVACDDDDSPLDPSAPAADGGAATVGAPPADGGSPKEDGATGEEDGGSSEADGATGPGGGTIESLLFPLDTIPTALITRSGASVASESGIESGQYRGALDENGNLNRDRVGLQYTFWARSTNLPGDGSGSRIYWTSKRSPRSLVCMGRNTSGSQQAYILDTFGGLSDTSPQPYPEQEVACSWELVKSTTDPERYAIKSLLFPLTDNRYAYVGTMVAGGTGAKYNIMPAAAAEPLVGTANVAWFKLNPIAPPVEN